QVPKWTASATPASTQPTSAPRPAGPRRVAISARRRTAATGASSTDEAALRQNAMARPDAAAYAISGADDEIARTATTRAAIVGGWIRWRPCMAANPDMPHE